MRIGSQGGRQLRRPAALAFGVVLVVAGVASCAERDQTYELSISGRRLVVEVADTPQTRSRGLMHRETLGADRGMLFVFDREAPQTFWMRNTRLPLSIAYIDSRLIIREIYDMEPLSLEPIPSRLPALYALEVNRGAFEQLGIRVGDRLLPSDALRLLLRL